jgi:pimeloyl-ACP methyl ester carboxylesterase
LSLQYKISGPSQAPVLFFLHGWPDSLELWNKQMEYFSASYHCVAITLPRFELDESSRNQPSYDFPELLQLIVDKIEEVLIKTGQKKIVLVGHDWGAYLTYLVEKNRPDLIEKLVTMDVGGHLKPSSLAHSLFILGYQWWLVVAYILGGPLGAWMTRWMSAVGRTPRRKNVHAKMNYPYFYYWRGILFKKYRKGLLGKYRPTRPILYLYGLKKKFQFHSEEWLKIVENTPGSKIVALKGCTHWLMLCDPEATNREMDAYLKESSS